MTFIYQKTLSIFLKQTVPVKPTQTKPTIQI